MFCYPHLKKAYREGRLLPFIGAGASIAVRWEKDGEERRGPSWTELVNQAVEIMGFESPDLARVRGSDFQILEYFKRKNSGQIAKLTNWLTEIMNVPDDALLQSELHTALASLDKCKLFYTTNFDNFLERSLTLNGSGVKVVAVEEEMAGEPQDFEVVKFHGDLDHPDQIVLTELDYEKRLSLSTAMDYRLRADLLGRVVLFIGYSFRDPNVSYLFHLFSNEFWNRSGAIPRSRAYIVVADPSDFEYELFRARHMEVIPVRGNNIENDITKLLQEIGG